MSGHLDLDALADVLAEEAPAAGPPARGHLSRCAECAQRLAELRVAQADVAASLAALPAPAVPPDLVDRITAAIAAEPPLTPPAERAGTAEAATVTPLSEARSREARSRDEESQQAPARQPRSTTLGSRRSGSRQAGSYNSGSTQSGSHESGARSARAHRGRRSGTPWLPAAAAGVVLVAGAGLGYVLLTSAGGSSANTAASAVSDSAGGTPATPRGGPPVPTSQTGTDYASAPSVASALPRVLAAPPVALGAVGPAGPGRRGAPAAPPADSGETGPAPAAGGGSLKGPASEDSGSGDPAEGASGAGSSGGGGSDADSQADTTEADPLERLRTADGLRSCLTALAPPEQPDEAPLALDYARYAGQPALAVALSDPDPTKVAVFVVGPGCREGEDQTLLSTRLDRPAR